MMAVLNVPATLGLVVLARADHRACCSSVERSCRAIRRPRRLRCVCYAIGLTGYPVVKVVSPTFYALHESRKARDGQRRQRARQCRAQYHVRPAIRLPRARGRDLADGPAERVGAAGDAAPAARRHGRDAAAGRVRPEPGRIGRSWRRLPSLLDLWLARFVCQGDALLLRGRAGRRRQYSDRSSSCSPASWLVGLHEIKDVRACDRRAASRARGAADVHAAPRLRDPRARSDHPADGGHAFCGGRLLEHLRAAAAAAHPAAQSVPRGGGCPDDVLSDRGVGVAAGVRTRCRPVAAAAPPVRRSRSCASWC